MTIEPWMIGVLFAAILIIGIIGLLDFFHGYEQQRELASRTALDEAERRANSLPVRMDASLRKTRLGKSVERRLVASGVKIRLSTFMLMISVAMLAAIYLIWILLAPLFGFVAAAAVAWGFFRYLRTREEKRREQFVAQLPEIARVLSNATSSGLALRTAIEMAAEEVDEPAGSELRQTSEALKLGQSTEEALRELGERLPSRELGVLVSTLLVSARAGGSLISALRNIATTLDSRKELRREVKTTFAQSVYSGYLVVAIGVGSLFLMNMMVPGVVKQMTTSLLGLGILISSGVLFALGLFLVNRVTRIDI